MANEIQANYVTGSTLYALIRNTIGQVWQTTSSTFVTYVTANIANYIISMAEQGTASGYYAGSLPSAIGAGLFYIIVKDRLGGSAAETDPSVATGDIAWDTTNVAREITFNELGNQVNLQTFSTSNVNLVRNAITGGAYALSTDSNGRIRIVDGTGAGEIDTLSGNIVQVNQLGTQAKADVNAEVLDVINTDTYVEPAQGTPAATASLATKINVMHKFTINEVRQTATTVSIMNNASSVVDHKATVSDDGTTYTRTKIVTGP